jgi:hypothetical protein
MHFMSGGGNRVEVGKPVALTKAHPQFTTDFTKRNQESTGD